MDEASKKRPIYARHLNQCRSWLNGCAGNVHSQAGEDGYIKAIFEKIGCVNKWCFEIGASDGLSLSNTAALIDGGWNALLIEQDDESFAFLRKRYDGNPHVFTSNAYVDSDYPLDSVLDSVGAPHDIDLGIIDVDEQDFWLWAGMERHRPRVMVVEYGFGRPVDQIPPLRIDRQEPVPQIQAGVNMIHYLGVAKGYTAVAITKYNIIFCSAELVRELPA